MMKMLCERAMIAHMTAKEFRHFVPSHANRAAHNFFERRANRLERQFVRQTFVPCELVGMDDEVVLPEPEPRYVFPQEPFGWRTFSPDLRHVTLNGKPISTETLHDLGLTNIWDDEVVPCLDRDCTICNEAEKQNQIDYCWDSRSHVNGRTNTTWDTEDLRQYEAEHAWEEYEACILPQKLYFEGTRLHLED